MAKTAFITGANSGVGLALTNLFLSRGWNVAATARDSSSPNLQNLASESEALIVQHLDLSDQTTFQPALDGAIEKFGKIDVLINNAGYGQFGVLEHLDIDTIRKSFEVNVFETNSPSRIIYVGSGASHFGLPLLGTYSASKAAMNLFMESLVYEMEAVDPPIKVKLVCPHGGITETNFSQTSMQLAGMDQMAPGVHERYGAFMKRTMQRFGVMQGQSMSAVEAAETVWTAATDQDATKLRYFVGPRDGGLNLQRRMRGGQTGEDADEVDRRYMEDMRATYM
ncbi:hypothetical protein G7Z17_g12981 [Cylindrodendrum hubeiense]|uniref:Uncharacterized protein n=1 Tax=Cylindrodendrum hubeiense TaxID=595255 RepID=A0A9P5LA19_9HYPO|nr:hypothetical protein G7Z17_g12981 [Cylindrodendrum hubeiense]